MPTNRITKYTFNGNLDFSSKIMSLDTAKWILSHLSAVNGKTIQFSNELWSFIEDDEEAIELLEEAYSRGWNSNEPDIIVIADSGYNGKVVINGTEKQLTQSTVDNSLWYGSAGTVTSLEGFIGGDTRTTTPHNSTATEVIKVRFGKNINTASCTTIKQMFCFWGTDSNTDHFNVADVRHLNTSNITDMSFAFSQGAGWTKFNIYGVENFNVAKVTTFAYMFNGNIENTLDLHTWHTLSNATVNTMTMSSVINTKIYYTPGYWKATFPNTDRVQLTVYPYHHITVAGNSSYTGKLRINNTNTQLTKDNTLNVWYYDVPSGSEITNLYAIGNANVLADQANIVSLNIRKDTPITTETVVLNLAFSKCINCRTVDFDAKINVSDIHQLFNMNDQTGSLGNIYGLENLTLTTNTQGNRWFRNCTNLRYVKMPEEMEAWSYTSGVFSGCTNLVRISNYPAQLTTVNQNEAPLYNCTSLTTIDACGAQYKTLDLSSVPLNLDSAKVILSALQTVTSETISFSATTWGYILADDEAIELLETAYSNGWNSNEPDIQVVAQSGYDGVVRLNGANKQLTNISGTEVWYGSAGTVTAMDDFLKHRNSTYYNSTSTNIKSVRFGKNINTASCTTLFAAFNCGNSTNTLFTKMDVRHLNTSSVTNFQATFADMANSVKSIIGLEDWNVSSGTNFRYLFNASYLGDATIDLHKWHISSSADILSMLGGLSHMSSYGQNTKFYYTPGYWGKDPMNDSNLAADRIKPTVYPYHDITIAGSSSFSGNILLNSEESTQYTATMTRDNTLGIWYYDVPSNVLISTLNRMLYKANDSTLDNVYSLSFAESIRSKIDFNSDFSLFGFIHRCYNMRTVDLSNLKNVVSISLNQMFMNSANSGANTTKISSIYGLEDIKSIFNNVEGDASGGNYQFTGLSVIRYLKLGEWNMFNYLTECFRYCSNLIRINRFPGVLSGCNTTNAMGGCTALTTIDSSGPISETLSFADCPLNVASAKVILSALQTVSGKTLTFSSTTKTAINGDSEALSLVTQARSKGWTISLS